MGDSTLSSHILPWPRCPRLIAPSHSLHFPVLIPSPLVHTPYALFTGLWASRCPAQPERTRPAPTALPEHPWAGIVFPFLTVRTNAAEMTGLEVLNPH